MKPLDTQFAGKHVVSLVSSLDELFIYFTNIHKSLLVFPG
jgi:hypothetical protein